MAGLSALIYLAIFGFIIYSVIKRSKNINTASRQAGSKTNAAAGAGARRPRGYTNYRPHKDIVSVSRDMGDKNSSVLRDDRSNDWLAKQLREEHRAFKLTSEMFDLKIEHASHCDARLLEQFHRRNCSAEGVDLANGKTVYHK